MPYRQSRETRARQSESQIANWDRTYRNYYLRGMVNEFGYSGITDKVEEEIRRILNSSNRMSPGERAFIKLIMDLLHWSPPER
jgi:hypothetical protein